VVDWPVTKTYGCIDGKPEMFQSAHYREWSRKMKSPQSFRLILVLCFAILFLGACSAAPKVTPTVVPPTAVPVAATGAPLPPTDTPTATETLVPPTDTPTAAPTETATASPSAALTDTPILTSTAAPTNTTVESTATRAVVATRIPPTLTSASLGPLTWTVRTYAPYVLHDTAQKLLNRQGVVLDVLNYYAASMNFSFPGNESSNAIVNTPIFYIPLNSVANPPFSIPANGFLVTVFKAGDYGWSAVIPGVGQAQGVVTLQKGQDAEIKFGP
jgi:hypothetical protein